MTEKRIEPLPVTMAFDPIKYPDPVMLPDTFWHPPVIEIPPTPIIPTEEQRNRHAHTARDHRRPAD